MKHKLWYSTVRRSHMTSMSQVYSADVVLLEEIELIQTLQLPFQCWRQCLASDACGRNVNCGQSSAWSIQRAPDNQAHHVVADQHTNSRRRTHNPDQCNIDKFRPHSLPLKHYCQSLVPSPFSAWTVAARFLLVFLHIYSKENHRDFFKWHAFL